MPAPATPNLRYTSGDFSSPGAVSLPVFDAPFKEDGINIDYVLTQDFQQNLASFAREALDTAHPDYPDFILVQESELRALSGGKVQWTRTYAKLPEAYEKARGNFNFTFPGKSGLVTGVAVGYGGSADGRLPLAKTVPVIIAREFYLTTDPELDIPILDKFKVLYGDQNTEWLNDTSGPGTPFDTNPTRTEYEAMVTAGDRLIAQDSTWDVWLGNIHVRETFYVRAQ